MSDVVIASAVRTAIGKFGGALANFSVAELGTIVVKEAIRRACVKLEDIDELIFGHVLQAGNGLNPARQVLLSSGIPYSIPAFTVNKVCASGMKAVALGASSIISGHNNIVVAGGMENMSTAPYIIQNGRWGFHLGDGKLSDCILKDALVDPDCNCHMAITAENLAEEFDINRLEQDQFAVDSQLKAASAINNGKFEAEIVPIKITNKKKESTIFKVDEHPRTNTTMEKLSTLIPAFKIDGTVTAGNSSGIDDGAAAIVLLSNEAAKRRGITPMAKIVSYASAGIEPERMGLGPVNATKKALDKAGLQLEDIDVIELNEAFAAQSLAVIKELGLRKDIVNVNGGAIALGHPVGASGARIIVTLLHIMSDISAKFGLATLCVGGGQGMAMILERYDGN